MKTSCASEELTGNKRKETWWPDGIIWTMWVRMRGWGVGECLRAARIQQRPRDEDKQLCSPSLGMLFLKINYSFQHNRTWAAAMGALGLRAWTGYGSTGYRKCFGMYGMWILVDIRGRYFVTAYDRTVTSLPTEENAFLSVNTYLFKFHTAVVLMPFVSSCKDISQPPRSGSAYYSNLRFTTKRIHWKHFGLLSLSYTTISKDTELGFADQN